MEGRRLSEEGAYYVFRVTNCNFILALNLLKQKNQSKHYNIIQINVKSIFRVECFSFIKTVVGNQAFRNPVIFTLMIIIYACF